MNEVTYCINKSSNTRVNTDFLVCLSGEVEMKYRERKREGRTEGQKSGLSKFAGNSHSIIELKRAL